MAQVVVHIRTARRRATEEDDDEEEEEKTMAEQIKDKNKIRNYFGTN